MKITTNFKKERGLPMTRIDQVVNAIVDQGDAGNWERVKEMLQAVPWGLITIEEAQEALKAATTLSAKRAFEELDIG
jgi:hypothetical protein